MRALSISILLIAAACTPPVATPTPSPTATATAAAPASASPVASSAASPTSPPAGVAGLQTSALGPLRGDWVFAVRETYVPEGVRVRVEVFAMPLAEQGSAVGGASVIASYLKSAGGVTLPPSEVLPRQFSPDGRRLALNTPMGIVLLELETGNARVLAEGQDPVWGYGERVAFIRGDPRAPRTQTTTWVIAASGGSPFEHSCGAALAWTFDGSSCIRPAAGGIVLDSPAQPAVAPGFGWSVAFDSPPAYEVPISVRPAPGVTVLAVASTDLPRGGAGQPRGDAAPYQHQIEVLSTPGAGQQTVVASESGRFAEVRFAAPRWNPRSDQIVYRIEGSRRMETHIVDASTKEDVVARISGVARAAEWTPNGEQIVYLTQPATAIGPATEVRAVRPLSGRDDRVLMTAPSGATFTSLAARGYAATSTISSNVGRIAARPDASAQGSKALEAFAADLYGELAKEPGNLVFSPYSVAAALAMTRAGAAGETAAQMDEVLHASLADDLDDAMNALDRALARRPGSYPFGSGTVPLELETANQLWGQHGAEFGQEFLDRLAAYYGAGMRLVDYVNAREAARQTINEWVSDRTRARIPELLQKEDLSPNTRLVLTNAIYLKAKWAQHFATAQPATFHLLDGTTAQMELMRRAGYAEYGRGAAHQTVRLRYVGGLSMVVIVPDRGSFAAVESDWRSSALRAVPEGLTGAYVKLGLPRFEMRTAVKLVPALSALGMPIAFTERADFSKMNPRVPMLIEAVAHEAFIAVDEHGTEAAAATAVVGGATGGGPSLIVDLTIDRPFMFAIQDDETGAILFMGRVLDPTAR